MKDFAALLLQHDDPLRWEYPSDFDDESAGRRFAELVDALASVVDEVLRVETGGAIQDASFHSQIRVRLAVGRDVLIRFSNFGDMVTVTADEPMPEGLLVPLVELLEAHGYVYVPANVLERPYTGTNHGVTGIRTWWIRYFDWV